MCSREVLQQFKDFGQETGRAAGDRLSKDQMKNQSQSHQPGLRGRPDKDQGKLSHQTPQSRLHVTESKSIKWIFELKSLCFPQLISMQAQLMCTKLLLLDILYIFYFIASGATNKRQIPRTTSTNFQTRYIIITLCNNKGL